MTETKKVVGQAILKVCRLSFADIYRVGKPRKADDGTMKPGNFGANFLLYKDAATFAYNMAELKRAGIEAKTKKWGDEKNWPKLKPERVCVRDGDLEDWEGYANAYYLSCNANRQPAIITNRKGGDGRWIPAVEGAPGSPYSGCLVNALVRLWGYETDEFGKRLNASVEVVQFYGDAPAFGAAPVDPNEVFGDDMVGDTGSFEDGDDTGLV